MKPHLVIALVLLTGCAVGLETRPRPIRRPPPVVVVGPPPIIVEQPPPPRVPPGQIRAQEVHERNAERKAAHDAEKARRKAGHGHGHDNDNDDDDDDDRGHGRGKGRGR
jgi:hypothetical protein